MRGGSAKFKCGWLVGSVVLLEFGVSGWQDMFVVCARDEEMVV